MALGIYTGTKKEMGDQRGLSKCTLADEYVSGDES